MDSKTLQHQHKLSGFVVEQNTKSISHDESLVQPDQDGNCLNWVLGHMVRTRLMQMQLLGLEAPYDMEKYGGYDKEPVRNGSDAMPWDTLMEQYQALQQPIDEGLGKLSKDRMAASAPFSPTNNPDETVGSLLAGISFHEAYHAGQLGLLRRICGKPGVIGARAGEEAAV